MADTKKFNKRTYKNLKEFFSDLWFPMKHRKQLQAVTKKGLLEPSFRERLMLAVTAVNGCRYCSYFHAKQALKSGVSLDDISKLLNGDAGACPEEEAVAVLYAQHWAESNGQPDEEAAKRLQDFYGEEKAAAINLMLRMIRMGNLSGNSWDYLLFRLTFGRYGG